MKTRRHHNNNGYRSVKKGTLEKQVTRMAARLDDRCLRCGECCRFKIEDEECGFFVAQDEYCPYFSLTPDGEGSCQIYGKHPFHWINQETVCLPAPRLAEARLLPEYCPYTRDIPGYRSLVINYAESERLAKQGIPGRISGGDRKGEVEEGRSTDGLLRLQPCSPLPLQG